MEINFNIMQKRVGFAFLIINLLVLNSCRKGSEDPIFSIYSRKARLAGDWNIVSYNENQSLNYTFPDGTTSNETFNRNFGTVNYVESGISATASYTYSGKISRSHYHFSKSGDWNSVIEYFIYVPQAVGGYYVSKTRIEEEGTWKFNDKNADLKKKESMELTTNLSGKFYYTYSTYLGTTIDSVADSVYTTTPQIATWRIIGLSKNRLKAVIESENSISSNVNGNAGTKITTVKSTDIEMLEE